jgi:hypothetical protein
MVGRGLIAAERKPFQTIPKIQDDTLTYENTTPQLYTSAPIPRLLQQRLPARRGKLAKEHTPYLLLTQETNIEKKASYQGLLAHAAVLVLEVRFSSGGGSSAADWPGWMVLGALGGTESGRRLWREGDRTGAIASVAEKSDLAKLYRSAGGGAERGLVDKAGNRLLDAGGGAATFAAEKVLELAGSQRACRRSITGPGFMSVVFLTSQSLGSHNWR